MCEGSYELDECVTIDDILRKIAAHRGVWVDSESEFRSLIFEKNCKYLEGKGVNPVEDITTLNICIKSDYCKLLEGVRNCYFKSNDPTLIFWKMNKDEIFDDYWEE